MKKNLLALLILPLLLISCVGGGNEPYDDYGLFRLTAGFETPGDASMGTHDIEFTFNGEAKKFIEVNLIGDFTSFSLADAPIPDWMTVTTSEKKIAITLSKNSGSVARTALIGFTVYKGHKSQKGSIQIYQGIITLEDMKKKEDQAIKAYLKKFDVIDELPAISDIQVGSVAPYYRLNPEGSVYMQLVRRGTAPAVKAGDKIEFRYFKYNLLTYLEEGKLPTGEGNLDSPQESPSTLILGSDEGESLRYGTGIQLPLLLGLPSNSEVNLVVASSVGAPADAHTLTPYLYNVRYLGQTE